MTDKLALLTSSFVLMNRCSFSLAQYFDYLKTLRHSPSEQSADALNNVPSSVPHGIYFSKLFDLITYANPRCLLLYFCF